MPDQDDIRSQQELLATYRRTLAHLLTQAAHFGGVVFAPVATANGIAEARSQIQRIKNALRSWGVPTDEHPNDTETIVSSLPEAATGQVQRDQNHTERTQIFISYSHSDKRWLERLQVHLKPLERTHTIARWDDTLIEPGSKWREEIDKALKAAKVAILLVSADFLASDFIAHNELPPLLKAAEEEGAVILSVIVSPCRFLQTKELSQFQAINPPSQPLVGLRRNNREAILVKVAEAVEQALTR